MYKKIQKANKRFQQYCSTKGIYKINIKSQLYFYMLAMNSWEMKFEKSIPFIIVSPNM